jgi:glycosyltransferase involved in cell wall biosynthesis
MVRKSQKINQRLVSKQQLKERLRKKMAVKLGPKTICLTCIMKNESANVNRLLDSVKSIIDAISIVDTGSTDNTEELILEWGKKHNIPTVVHHEPFRNFAYNRTHSFRAAKEAFPNIDYMLLSDADFVWDINVGSKFDKVLLTDHKYLIEQYNKSLSYWNIRLLSSKVDFECVGVTHEYWQESKNQKEYGGEVRTAKIYTLRIDDREDGGCKSDKFERDERLLREGLLDENTPDNLKTRYKFYLAQTLKDVGRHEESIEWYKKRCEDKGWAEEVYYAKFQIGFNYEQLGHKIKHVVTILAKEEKNEHDIAYLQKWNPENLSPSEIVQISTKHFTNSAINYMAAYNYRKTRSESLYYCTRMYRVLGMNQNAYDLAVLGKKIKYPDSDTLFIERGCYEYNFDYEISIVAWHLPGKKDIGREAIKRLMERTDLPSWMRDNVERNSRTYL